MKNSRVVESRALTTPRLRDTDVRAKYAAHVKRHVSHVPQREEKRDGLANVRSLVHIRCTMYACTMCASPESVQRIKQRDEERRGISVDVKNETTRCEYIDEPTLLKRTCYRNERKKKRERVTFPNVQPRSDPSSDEYKITSHFPTRFFSSLSSTLPFTPFLSG